MLYYRFSDALKQAGMVSFEPGWDARLHAMKPLCLFSKHLPPQHDCQVDTASLVRVCQAYDCVVL